MEEVVPEVESVVCEIIDDGGTTGGGYIKPIESDGITYDDDTGGFGNWTEYTKAVESGKIKQEKISVGGGHPRYSFNIDTALDSIDLTFKNYTPSADAVEFFSVIRAVMGEDFESDSSTVHYFFVDLIFDNITREMFPYSPEVNAKIRLNNKKIAIIASRFSAKSTIITAFMPIYVAITGKMPNFGPMMFWVSFGDSQQAGAKVQANTIRDICKESDFCKSWFEKMRFTDEECEFIRKGDANIRKRSFMFKVKGAAGGSVRGIRYMTERPQCHEVGTIVTTDIGKHEIEKYPYNHGVYIENGLEIRLRGLTDTERVTLDHKYWSKTHDSNAGWIEAKDLTRKHYIGMPVNNGFFWRQVESARECGKISVVPITVKEPPLKSMPKSTYLTSFGMSKNCLSFDDAIKNEAEAASTVIMTRLRSMIYSDAENALGKKGKIIIVNTPFNKSDPVYTALESGVWTPLAIPLCEKINIGMKKEEYVGSWEEMKSFEEVYERYEDAVAGKTIREFNQELMLRISSEEDRLITEEIMNHMWYSQKSMNKYLDGYNLYCTTDYTASNEMNGGDMSGIAMWAVNSNMDWYMIDLVLKENTIEGQFTDTISMVQRWKSRTSKEVVLFVETDGQQRNNIYTLKELQLKHNVWFQFGHQIGVPATKPGISRRRAGGDKHSQFMRIQHLFQQNKIFFPEEMRTTMAMKELLDEFKYATYVSLGASKDDGIDLVSAIGLGEILYPSVEADMLTDGSNRKADDPYDLYNMHEGMQDEFAGWDGLV